LKNEDGDDDNDDNESSDDDDKKNDVNSLTAMVTYMSPLFV